MGNERTHSGVLGELRRFSSALEANAVDLAHLDGVRLRLAKIVGDAQGIAQQQAELRASKQEASRKLKATLVEGQRLASGLRSFLQENYGTRSEKLAEFGLQPFRGRKARTPKTPQPPEAATAPLPAPAAGPPEAGATPQP
ncbi:MAG TPA: hypothetical protein VLX28_11695 [Thermoanaerobaculia bacterium]|nr:hypothetical protein [Thermoanaerobaculia bacterium]